MKNESVTETNEQEKRVEYANRMMNWLKIFTGISMFGLLIFMIGASFSVETFSIVAQVGYWITNIGLLLVAGTILRMSYWSRREKK